MVGENFNKPIKKMIAKANKDKMVKKQKALSKKTGDIIQGKGFKRSKLKKDKKIKKGPVKLADKMDVDEPVKPKSKSNPKPKKDENAMDID